MALETTFRELSVSLHKLHDALNALHVTVGDKPPNDEAAVADGLENALLDMMGALQETRKGAMEAQKAVAAPTDLDRARRALTACQESFHRIEQHFATDLVAYEKLRELARIGRARRHEWIPWANSTKQGIDQCREPMEHVSAAIAACWQELAERLGTMNITMQATNVGQQITVSKPKVEDFEVEGVT